MRVFAALVPVRKYVAMVAALVLAVLLSVVAFALAGGTTEPQKAERARAALGAVPSGVEVPSMRTEHSRSYRQPDGSVKTKLSLDAVNYRGSDGKWRPVDSRLKRTSAGVENAAGALKVRLPDRAEQGPVRVQHGDVWVSFGLRGAKGAAAVSKSTARYSSVLPGVSLRYDMGGSSLKESLVLASSRAASSYVFDVRASDGVTPELSKAGEVVFRDRSGKRQLAWAAPWMKDAAGVVSHAVRYEIDPTAGGWTVRVIADERWLQAKDRRFPVEVDPTTYVGFTRVCEIASGSLQNTSNCTTSDMTAGVGRENGRVHRLLVKFDIDEIRSLIGDDQLVTSADFFYWYTAANPATVQLNVHELTRSFEAGATWNTYDGTNAWTYPGGDGQYEPESWQTMYSDWVGGWVGLGVGRLVQGWMDGTIDNHGIGVIPADESLDRIDNMQSFGLVIESRPKTGAQPQATFEQVQPTAGSKARVNVANGNLVLAETDLTAGSGNHAIGVERTHNSLGDLATGTFGSGWVPRYGAETTLWQHWVDRSYILEGPGGLAGRFHRKADYTYQAPPGWNATLVENNDSTVTVTFTDTGEQWEFDTSEPRRLTKVTRSGGYEIDLTYGPGGLVTLEDSDENTVTYTYDAQTDELQSVSDATTTREYELTGGKLLAVAPPSGTGVQYTYDSNDRLSELTYPGASRLAIAYDSTGRVTSLTQKPDSNPANDLTTTFTYSSPTTPCLSTDFGKTTVTYPNAQTRTYCHERNGTVRAADPATSSDVTDPVLTLDGPAWTARGDWYRTGTIALAAFGSDGHSGVKTLEIKINDTVVDTNTQACAAGRCSMQRDVEIDLTTLDEGPNAAEVTVNDIANRTTTREWDLKVDRTAPSLAVSGSLWDARGSWAEEPSLELSAAATDALSGVASVEVLIDDVRHDFETQTCLQGACPLAASSTVDVTELDAGTHDIEVRVTDVAGHVTQESWTVEVDTDPPVNTAAPTISGTAEVGETLTAQPGTWTSASPLSYSYQWQRCTVPGGACDDLSGATSATLVLEEGDAGHAVRVLVRAHNAAGTASELSASTAEIVEGGASAFAVSINGTARAGDELRAAVGDVDSSASVAFSYQWQRCDAVGNGCQDIALARRKTLSLSLADIGGRVRVVAHAMTALDDLVAYSTVSDVVTEAAPKLAVEASGESEPPAIFGRAAQGHTLTAGLGRWSPDSVSTSVQWRRCDATGTACAPITDATASTYQVSAADIGATVDAVVTATTTGGTASVQAPATRVVPNPTLLNAAPPTISQGPGAYGTELTADPGTWTGAGPIAYRYQWQRCGADGLGCLNILDAVDEAYTIDEDADMGARLRVLVIAANDQGSETATSPPTAPLSANPPSSVLQPSIEGAAAVGETLVAGTGTWNGTGRVDLTYQWQTCDANGSDCQDIEDQTDETYDVFRSDVENTLRVRVTATNETGSATVTSTATDAVSAVLTALPEPGPTLTGAPTITGDPQVGQTLTASSGLWSGSGTITYEYLWQSCDPTGCALIEETGSTYTPEAEDVGSLIGVVVVAHDATGSRTAAATTGQTVRSLAGPANNVSPTITGTVKEGQQLALTQGTWTGAGAITFTYRWQRCDPLLEECYDIDATDPTYTATRQDVGETLRALVIATDAEDETTVAQTEVTAPVAASAPWNTTGPAITGTTETGDTLTAGAGEWEGDATIAYTHQWQRCASDGEDCDDIGGATASTYTLAADDADGTVRVVVTATNGAGSDAALSDATGVIAASEAPVLVSAPTVSSTARAGDAMSGTDGEWSSPTAVTYTYRWQSCTRQFSNCFNIEDATSATYVPTDDNVGRTLRVAVTAHNDAGSRTAFSEASRVVAPSNEPAPTSPADGLSNTANPQITGSANVDSSLAASSGTWTGIGSIAYTYQWRTCAPAGTDCAAIVDATDATYVPTIDDLGLSLRVAVTASNSWGTVTVVSDATEPVGAAAPVNVEMPSIAGDAIDGSALTAEAGEWAGEDLTYSFQWQRCDTEGDACSLIAGATESTYDLVSDDVAHTLRVVVTASNGESGAAQTSEPSSLIAAAPPVPRDTNAYSFDTPGFVGVTLSLEDGDWSGTAPFTFAYQWYRCTASECDPIDGATTADYQLTVADVGLQVGALVTATNSAGQNARGVVLETPVEAATAPALLEDSEPTISGFAHDGRTLTLDPGQWTGGHPIGLAYQWQRCDQDGNDCADIAGATDTSYVAAAADIGHTLRGEVTATHPAGTTTAPTTQTDVVTTSAPANTAEPSAAVDIPHVGQPLTASDRGTWAGSGPISYAYQWQRCTLGGSSSCSDIDGAIDTTYVATAADADHELRVKVTATNVHGSSTAASSRQRIWLAPPTNISAPEITGSMLIDETLTASPGVWSYTPDSFEYQWQKCDATSCWDLTGETGATYVEPYEAAGAIRVVVTARNTGDPTPPATAASAKAPLITRFPEARFMGSPTMSPSAPVVGDEVTINLDLRGQRPMDVQYQWRLCTGFGWGCQSIPGATSPAYTPRMEDIGKYLFVDIDATNAINTATTFQISTQPIADGPPQHLEGAQVTGDAVIGAQLGVDIGQWSGATAWEFSWERCNATGDDCTAIDTDEGGVYRPVESDVGSTFRAVVTGKSTHGQASITTEPSAAVTEATRPTPDVRPEVIGDPVVGHTMSSSTGTWSGSPDLAYEFEWERCNATGTDCSLVATAADYRLRRGDAGHAFRVAVTATNGWGSVTTRSLPSAVVPPAPAIENTTEPSIDLFTTPRFDNQFTGGTPGTWDGDPDITHQWQRCDPLTADPETGGMDCNDIPDATDPRSYTPVAADIGFRLRLKETATAPGHALTEYTAASQPVDGWISFGQGTIDGSHIVGQTITANQPISTSGDLPADIHYEFSRNDGNATVLQNSTSPTYEIQPDDAGHTITVRVHVELRRADDTTAVLADWTTLTGPTVDIAPENDERPAISGNAVVGATLTATTGTWHGGGELTYAHRWSRCDINGENCTPITDATDSTYRLAQSDIGATIRVAVTASNGHVAATANSVATTGIAEADAPTVQDVPTVSGEAVRRSTLTADPGTWSGDAPITYTYQWQVCEPASDDCEDIDSETSATYVINGGAEDGQVRVVVTASNGGGSTSAVSLRTDLVSELAPVLRTQPGLTRLGLPQPGATLMTDGGEWDNADQTQLRYRWERCHLLGTCEEIEGEDAPSYTITTDDVNTQLRVRVSVISELGTTSATSAVSDAVTSPTGDSEDQVVYLNEERTGIYLVNSDGTGSRLVTDCQALVNNGSCELFAPRISPNLQTIIVENRGGASLGQGRVLSVNIDGTGLREVTTGSEPRWSSDGTSIYLTVATSNSPGQTQLGVIPADANNADTPEPLITGPIDQRSVDASPDESQFVFAARETADAALGLFIANENGTGASRLNLPSEIGDVKSAAFSNDGASIVFTANSTVGDEATGDIRRIWEIDTDGSNLRPITPPGATYGVTTTTTTNIVTTRQRALWAGSASTNEQWVTLPPATTIIDTETNTQQQLPYVGYDASPAPRAIASRRPSVPALVRKYAPYVMPHSEDQFRPIWFGWVGRMRNEAGSAGCIRGVTKPRRPAGCIKAYTGQALPAGAGVGQSLEYPAENDRDQQSRLLMRALRSRNIRSQLEVPYVYYFVGDRDPDGSFVVQYWYFYTYNHFPDPAKGDVGEHEGDWEHVDLRIDRLGRPRRLAFSAHEGSVPVDWGSPKVVLIGGTHPVAYAARGSHAMSPQCRPQKTAAPGFKDTFTCWRGDMRRFGAGPANVRSDLRKLTRQWACWKGLLGHRAAATGAAAEAPLVQLKEERYVRGAASACEEARP